MPRAIMDSDGDGRGVLQHPACGDALRHCNNCLKRETTGVKLRKCAGCSSVVYCSSECQKAEWPRHKPMCQTDHPGDTATVARYGYTSVSAFTRDLADFLDAHTWAFRMLVTVQRQLQVDANPGVPIPHLPRLLRFRLRCQTTRSNVHKHRNPATRFAIVAQTFTDMDAYARKNELWWEQSTVLRNEATRAFAQQYPGHNGDFIAVEYKVPGTHGGAMNYFPLQTPRAPAPGTAEQRRPILEDMVDFCTRSINYGFPMRMRVVGDAFTKLAYPGTFVRMDGCWTWKAILEEWKSYAPGQHRALDVAVRELKTRMPIAYLIDSTLRITSGVSVLLSQDAFRP
ncbi:hypothetical protein L226DRAFT_561292 [Lentinus tigrinus ALCF2SS1-7]|uniref:MYND-type domain-containing protein n=1 Tax=Lentinus tigrinus ALCF2SS1-6 TaxID=1328759 RepID=A0A5C2S642_9APHY|nr:hypothetical protein L227DRAFT_601585 [Lentinus tigrinus ALCF2SS1-6]RPD73609.1 hypothetical protein L226DRAFT_561292 [Lentinus tigrinus ALCF2SS1-7]